MPSEQPLLIIPNDFVDNVLCLISDESPVGTEKIRRILILAERNYAAPVESWVTGWFFSRTRTRGEEVERSIDAIKDYPDAYHRLQKFKELIQKGEWKTTSYNYYLFRELINNVPGYEPLKEAYAHDFVLALQKQIIEKIESFLVQYEKNEKLKQAREAELKATQKITTTRIESVLLLTGLEEARTTALQFPDKEVFYLSKGAQWKLFLLDSTGKEHALELTEELNLKLANRTIDGFSQLKPVHLNPIKNECIKAKDAFLSRTQLHINPSKSNEELLEDGLSSAFILRHDPKGVQLWWINSLGTINPVPLAEYPQLDGWLKENVTGDEWQIKLHLLSVKTSQTIASNRLNLLNNLLEKKFSKILPTKKLDLSDFSHLARHLESRLTKSKPGIDSETREATSKDPATHAEPVTVKPLAKERYESLTGLYGFWQKKQTEHLEPLPQASATEFTSVP